MRHIDIVEYNGLPFTFPPMDVYFWQHLPAARVCLWDLIFTRTNVELQRLSNVAFGEPHYGTDPLIWVVDYGGKLFLVNGHHRVWVWLLQGHDYAMGRVLKAPCTLVPYPPEWELPPRTQPSIYWEDPDLHGE